MATMIPEASPAFDRGRVIERPDGFYWQDKDTDRIYGPFASLWEAMEDMKDADASYDPEETLEVQEADVSGAHLWDEDWREDGSIDFDRL